MDLRYCGETWEGGSCQRQTHSRAQLADQWGWSNRCIKQDDTVHIQVSANSSSTNRAAREDEGEHISQSLASEREPALWDTQQEGHPSFEKCQVLKPVCFVEETQAMHADMWLATSLWGQSWDLLTRPGVPVGRTHFKFQEDTGSN